VRSLDGEWQLRGCLGEEWRWHVGPERPWDAPGWFPARVPGSVLDDLVRAGEAPDPRHERDSRLSEWVPERTWIYRRRLVVDAPLLRCEGVDHACTVLLDGQELAEHEGLFRPFEVDVSGFADGDEHLLAIVVHPAPASEPQVGRTSRVRVHKPRMNYGWDFCPRLVHQGIWRPVLLVDRPVRHPSVVLRDGVGTVEADGEVVLRVEEPELWWPNGMGAQRLYPVELDDRLLHVGFRTVELVPPEPGVLPYAVVVNGERMYVKGWNWCPVDALYGVPQPERLARLLELAARAHVNLLRVWGGGLLETPEFYARCDRLGLLVWQEFSQSSSGQESEPAADQGFVELMRAEADAVIPPRRHHPSLAVWCGGNELTRRRDGGDVPLDDTHPVLAALHGAVRELDPGRAWLPTSPSGPRFANRLETIAVDPEGLHDVHGPWEHQGLREQYALYDAGTAILHSEFGVEGMTNRDAHERLIDAEHRWPADRSNPVYEHLGAWWNNAPFVQRCFGGRIDGLETMRRASQWLQYDGLRYAVEANMRRPRSVGVIPWQLNESFPNAWCTAAVDWHGEPKPAYWGVARAYRPDHPSAQFATCAWGGEREVRARIHGDVTARLVNLDGTVVAEARDEIAAPVASLDSVFVLDLDGRNRYVMTTSETLAPLLDLPRAQVSLGGDTLSNTGTVAALGLVLRGDVVDNMLDLLPGESRVVGAASAAEGWNAAA
jgi:beta-mannosidase